MTTSPTEPIFPDIGIGILSWKGYRSLENSLQIYADKNLLDLFGERRIFLPEAAQEGRDIARSYGMEFSESKENLGILGGFEALAHSLSTPYVLLLENDLPLIEPREQVAKQLAYVKSHLQSDRAQVARLRHRIEWGHDFDIVEKFKRYYSGPDEHTMSHLVASIRRTIRPGKAFRLSGNAVYVYENAHEMFPNEITYDAESDMFFVSSSIINWTNQSILIKRDFFLDQIINYANNAPTTRRINGFRNLEIEMNSPYWTNSGWNVCVTPGLFSHDRKEYRGY